MNKRIHASEHLIKDAPFVAQSDISTFTDKELFDILAVNVTISSNWLLYIAR